MIGKIFNFKDMILQLWKVSYIMLYESFDAYFALGTENHFQDWVSQRICLWSLSIYFCPRHLHFGTIKQLFLIIEKILDFWVRTWNLWISEHYLSTFKSKYGLEFPFLGFFVNILIFQILLMLISAYLWIFNIIWASFMICRIYQETWEFKEYFTVNKYLIILP